MIVCTPVPLLLVREPPLDNLARTRHSTLWPLASVMPVVVTPRFFAHFPHTSTFSLASSWPFSFCSREFSFLASFSFFPFLWKWRNGNSFWRFNEGLKDRWFGERDIEIFYDWKCGDSRLIVIFFLCFLVKLKK